MKWKTEKEVIDRINKYNIFKTNKSLVKVLGEESLMKLIYFCYELFVEKPGLLSFEFTQPTIIRLCDTKYKKVNEIRYYRQVADWLDHRIIIELNIKRYKETIWVYL